MIIVGRIKRECDDEKGARQMKMEHEINYKLAANGAKYSHSLLREA